ncbi:hypothetical protein BJ165DRAFT_1066125 [Panaeolus papilionaceus]|nr:hypothetical protein BJ165DRAFT_1066125 [Panaeolus papilionaceus]
MSVIVSPDVVAYWKDVETSVSYVHVAVAACVLFDHVTTLDAEVELVWVRTLATTMPSMSDMSQKRNKWSTVQFLFLINRYVGLAYQLYAACVLVLHVQFVKVEVSHTLGLLQGFLIGAILFSMQGIMLYRISSLYEHKRSLIIFLITAFTFEILSVFTINILGSLSPVPHPDHVPGIELCTRESYPAWTATMWIPMTLLEVMMLSLAIVAGLRFQRSRSFTLSHGSLIYLVLRDSILFPFIAVIVCVLNVIAWTSLNYLSAQATIALCAFIPNILGSRLLLNLREAYYQPFGLEYGDNHGESVL